MKKALLTFLIVGIIGAVAFPVRAFDNSGTNIELANGNDEIKLGQNYPNPAVDKTYINVNFTSPKATLTVYNVLGTVIERRVIVDQQIVLDVSNYTEGVYLYTLEADGQKMTRRLTVKKH